MNNNIEQIFKKKADYYEEAIKAFETYRSGAYGSGINLFKWLGDFCLFTVLGLYDLWILQCDYNRSINAYQQNYYARQTALLCFELLSDIPQNINDSFQKLLIDKIIDPEINDRARSIRKRLNHIRYEKESELKDIRNVVTAHRNHNVSKHIDIINKMNNSEIMRFALDYMKLIEELNVLFNDVIIYLRMDQERLNNDRFIEKYSLPEA